MLISSTQWKKIANLDKDHMYHLLHDMFFSYHFENEDNFSSISLCYDGYKYKMLADTSWQDNGEIQEIESQNFDAIHSHLMELIRRYDIKEYHTQDIC